MDTKKKRVAIVGAGPSGLAACKHALAKGFRPVVFESGTTVGGVWNRTLASTRLQTPAAAYRFSDFPWPASADDDVASAKGLFPRHDQVAEYLTAYARRFGVLEHVRFGCKVLGATYVGATEQEVAAWERWSGNGEAFGDGTGEWHLTVRHGDGDGDGESESGTQRWLISKLAEVYYKRNIPMQKHGMVPDCSFSEGSLGWRLGILPDGFYDRVDDGSVELRRYHGSIGFCADGLVLDGGVVVGADVAILSTGFHIDRPLRDVFTSPRFGEMVAPDDGGAAAVLPLYRHCLHPRVPQMAVVGYAESGSAIYPYEMMAKWVAHLLDGAVRLPAVRDMERDVAEWARWGRWARRACGGFFLKACIASVTTWYHDQLCRDMGHRPKRKAGLLEDWLQPYGPADYAGIQ